MGSCYIKEEVERKWGLFNPEQCIDLGCKYLEAKLFSKDSGAWQKTKKNNYNEDAVYLCEKENMNMAKWPQQRALKKVSKRPIQDWVYSLTNRAANEDNISKLVNNSKVLIKTIKEAKVLSHEDLFEKFDYEKYNSTLAVLIKTGYVKKSKIHSFYGSDSDVTSYQLRKLEQEIRGKSI